MALTISSKSFRRLSQSHDCLYKASLDDETLNEAKSSKILRHSKSHTFLGVHRRRMSSSSIEDLQIATLFPSWHLPIHHQHRHCSCNKFLSTNHETIEEGDLSDLWLLHAAMMAQNPASPSIPLIPQRDIQILPKESNGMNEGGEVGAGHSGIVYKAWYRPERTQVALKTLHGFQGAAQKLPTELALTLLHRRKRQTKNTMNTGEHDVTANNCIVKCFGVLVMEWRVSLVMEWMDGGSLQALIESKPYQEALKQKAMSFLGFFGAITKSILLALDYLHNKLGVAHGDVRPSNVLLSRSSGCIKLGDFGESRTTSTVLSPHDSLAHLMLGSEAYMPPEHLLHTASISDTERGTNSYNNYNSLSRDLEKADLWALGVSLHEVVTGGQHPFGPAEVLADLVAAAMQDEHFKVPYPNDTLMIPLNDFLSSCLEKDVRKRPCIQELLQHPLVMQHAWDERTISKWLQSLQPING